MTGTCQSPHVSLTLTPCRVRAKESWVSGWMCNWSLNYSPCTEAPSHHLVFRQQPRLLLGQGCNMVHSNLSSCQHVKTTHFFFFRKISIMSLIVRTAHSLVDGTGYSKTFCDGWKVTGGGSIWSGLALFSLFACRIWRLKKVPLTAQTWIYFLISWSAAGLERVK